MESYSKNSVFGYFFSALWESSTLLHIIVYDSIIIAARYSMAGKFVFIHSVADRTCGKFHSQGKYRLCYFEHSMRCFYGKHMHTFLVGILLGVEVVCYAHIQLQ